MMDFIKQHLLIIGAALVAFWYFCMGGGKKSYRRSRGRSRSRGRAFGGRSRYGRSSFGGRRY